MTEEATAEHIAVTHRACPPRHISSYILSKHNIVSNAYYCIATKYEFPLGLYLMNGKATLATEADSILGYQSVMQCKFIEPLILLVDVCATHRHIIFGYPVKITDQLQS
jgi:hypothetical protein